MGTRRMGRIATATIVMLGLAGGMVTIAPSIAGAATPPTTATCTITGTDGPDVLRGTGGSDVICGLGGNDDLDGLGGDDLLRGGEGDDALVGSAGADRLEGGAGHDVLSGGTENDVVSGGTGRDTLSYSLLTSPVTVDLGRVDSADAGVTYSHGNGVAGEDDRIGSDVEIVVGSDANDTLRGSDRNEDLDGRLGADTIDGGDGVDVVAGGGGNDDLRGGAGSDLVVPGPGNDVADAGEGADQVNADVVTDGADTLTGGPGIDALSYGLRTAPVVIDLTRTGPDQGTRGPGTSTTEGDRVTGFEQANGGEGADLIIGSAAVDTLKGNGGADEIRPGDGADTVAAGDGNDVIRSVDGVADQIDCGPGVDGTDSDASLDVLTACETVVLPELDLSLSLSGPAEPVQVGQVGQLTATVTSLGTVTETKATVRISIPGQTGLDGGATCVPDGPTAVLCGVGPIPAGVSRSVGIRVAPTTPGSYAASATIAARRSTADPNPANDTAAASYAVEAEPVGADLAITSVGLATSPPNTTMTDQGMTIRATYVVAVDNRGPVPDTAQLTLPSGNGIAAFTWDLSSLPPGAGCDGIRCTVPLFVDTPTIFRLPVVITNATPSPLATVWLLASATDTPDPNPGDNDWIHTMDVPTTSDVSVTDVSLAGPANTEQLDTPGLRVDTTYQVTVRNEGLVANDAVLTLPVNGGGVTFTWDLTQLPAGVTCTSATTTTCKVPLKANGVPVTLTLPVRIDGAGPSAVTPWRIVPAPGLSDPDLDDNLRTHTLTTPREADVAIVSVVADPAQPKATLTAGAATIKTLYRVTLKNDGPVTNKARLTLPVGTSRFTWDLGQLPPGTCTTTVCTVRLPANGAPTTLSLPVTITTVGQGTVVDTHWDLQPAPGLTDRNSAIVDHRLEAIPVLSSVSVMGADADFGPGGAPVYAVPRGTTNRVIKTTYRVRVANSGTFATDARLVLPRPSTGTTFAWGAPVLPTGGSCTAAACTVPLAPGSTAAPVTVSLPITITIASATGSSSTVATAWTIEAGPGTWDPISTDNVTTSSFQAVRATSEVAVTVEPTTTAPGYTLVNGSRSMVVDYVVRLLNKGPHRTEAVVTLPTAASSGLRGLSWSTPQGLPVGASCTTTTCTVPVAVSGVPVNVFLRATMTAPHNTLIPNQVVTTAWRVDPADGVLDPNGINNATSTLVTGVPKPADVSITGVAVTPSTPTYTAPTAATRVISTTYKVSMANRGAPTVARLTLPLALTSGAQQLTWDFTSLPPGVSCTATRCLVSLETSDFPTVLSLPVTIRLASNGKATQVYTTSWRIDPAAGIPDANDSDNAKVSELTAVKA